MRFRATRFALVTIAAIVTGACGDIESNHASHEMVTEHGEMTITAVMDPEEPTQLGPNVMTLALSMGEMSVTNATITVVPTMPGHGAHGTNEVPVVTETGDGVYEVTNLVFTMPGTWQLEVRVVATDGMETNKHFAYTVR